MYIDPLLLKSNKVDSFQIEFNKSNYIKFYLDSTGSVYKKKFYAAEDIKKFTYTNNGLNNYTCYEPYEAGSSIECENHKIIKFKKSKSVTTNKYDKYGRLLLTKTKKKGESYYEIFEYSPDGSVKQVILSMRFIKFVFLYEYIERKLQRIVQLKKQDNEQANIGQALFNYYRCGLVKDRTGFFLNGSQSLSCNFKYFSKGIELE